MRTLAEVTAAHGFEVLGHLETDAEVPVNDGLQAQGDLIIRPRAGDGQHAASAQAVTPDGIAIIEAVGSGHEHRLFAGTPGTAWWTPAPERQVLGVLECSAPAYVLHPEHGATGIAPGRYELRRQRVQADEERLVAD